MYYTTDVPIKEHFFRKYLLFYSEKLKIFQPAAYSFGRKLRRYDMSKNTTPLDNETAELIRAAKAGNADAQADLAWYYDNGEGVEIDHEKATYWYTQAAEQNHATAQFNLAMCYEL